MRTSPAVCRRQRSVRRLRDLRQEGALPVRNIRSPGGMRDQSERFCRVRVSVRPHFFAAGIGSRNGQAPIALRRSGTLAQLSDSASRIRGVFVPALRPSFLLRGSRDRSREVSKAMTRERYAQGARWLALALAYALFLWMFLSVTGIDVAGNTLVATGNRDLGHAVHVFAADWRHGLNGHSPLFMPGFFALTPAAWYWSGKQSVAQLLRGGATALLAGLLLAALAAPIGRAAAANAFFDEFHLAVQSSFRDAWQAAATSAFTAICWTVLVVAIRRAITVGTSRPLVLALGLYLLLGVSRHWWSLDHLKQGDDVARWETRAAQGDAVAVASALAVPLLGLVLATTTMSARRRRDDFASQ